MLEASFKDQLCRKPEQYRSSLLNFQIFEESHHVSFSEPSHSLASYCRMFLSVSMYLGNVFCERDTTICMKVKVIVTQSCLTLCDPVDCSLPGSSVHGILQARILELVACPPPGDLPDSGIKPVSLMFPALAARFFISSITWEAQYKRLLVWKCAITVIFLNLNILVKWHVWDLF